MTNKSRRLRRVWQKSLDFDPAAVIVRSEAAQQQVFRTLPDGGRRMILAARAAWKHELTPTQQKYLLLYYSQGMTMREIAGRYRVATPTVSRTVKRARERLRKVLLYALSSQE